jgi:hypothetical protein
MGSYLPLSPLDWHHMTPSTGAPDHPARATGERCIPHPYTLRLSFAAFGLLNNVVYVLILSSAADLVTTDVPKVSRLHPLARGRAEMS